MSNAAECSVKNNSQVCWGWNVLKFFAAPQDVQLSVGLSVCFGYGIRIAVSFLGCHTGGF